MALLEERKEAHSLHFTITQSIKNTYSVWFISLCIVLPAWRELTPWVAIGWAVVVSAAYAVRARALSAARELETVSQSPRRWALRLNLWTLGCGALAALGPALFYPLVGDTNRMYICMIYCCWLAGAMASLGARRRLYGAYALLFTAGLWLGWLRSDSEHVVQILVMLAMYAVVLSGFAINFAKQVDAGIEIRFVNERLVAELTQAREAAEKSNEAKSRFLAVASHDLRQPLHAVTLLNGMLARPQRPEQVQEISRQMGRSLTTLERLFSSVLDFSKIEAEKVTPQFAWHAIEPLFEQLSHEYAAQATQKGLVLRTLALPLALRTDDQLLMRVLRNLLENALKFTEDGGIELAAAEQAGGLVVSVSDTGPGVPASLREDIFKEYYQTAGTKTHAGLGLGLAIVRRLAALLGLRVTLGDAKPRGARFEIVFDAASVRPAHEVVLAEQAEARAEGDLNGYFVLYVDDDASARDALRLLLTDWGCRVIVAESLDQALQRLEGQGTPQAVLSDFALGAERTGVEVIEQMRARYGPLAGAILTGESSAMRQRLASELEYPVLSKPVTVRELRSLLEVFKEIG